MNFRETKTPCGTSSSSLLSCRPLAASVFSMTLDAAVLKLILNDAINCRLLGVSSVADTVHSELNKATAVVLFGPPVIALTQYYQGGLTTQWLCLPRV